MVQPLVIKFGSLVIKTLTKPLANNIKSKAQQPGWIRQVCLRYGRFHHRMESRAILRLAGHNAKSVKGVSEEAAVAIGATVISELTVFGVAGTVLAIELWKKSQDDEASKRAKEAQAAKDKRDIEDRFLALEMQLSSMAHSLQNAHHELHRLRDGKEPPKPSGSGATATLMHKLTGKR